MKAYEIWFEPTKKGKEVFGWKEEKVSDKPYTNKEDAQLDCYPENCDDPTPDKYEYGRYVLREIDL